MTSSELDALAELVIDWAPVPDDVWRQSQFHVDGLHPQVARAVNRGITRAKRENGAQLGIVIQGRKGAGKTHLLGWVRGQVQQDDGYFFLVTLHDGVSFWSSVLHCVLESLLHKGDRAENQLQFFLRRIAAELGMPVTIQDAVAGGMGVPASALDILIDAFRAKWPDVGDDWHDTLRALVLRASRNVEAIEVGRAYLQAREENEPGERKRWGIGRPDAKSPQWILKDLIGLLALTGPIVVAVDQIDALLAVSGSKLDDVGASLRTGHKQQANAVAAGLMDLREQSPRTLLVVACLPTTWTTIAESSVASASDRFREVLTLGPLPNGEVATELVAKRFAPAFEAVGFAPRYPTWPALPEAFEDAGRYFPRRLLQLIDGHINYCLDIDKVVELKSFDDEAEQKATDETKVTKRVAHGGEDEAFGELDTRFQELRANADVSAALDAATEDEAMPPLLAAGLGSWILEQDAPRELYHYDLPPSGTPEIHGRLRMTLQDEVEAERHWTLRAIASTNHTSALNRLRGADGASGISPGGTSRMLIILRNPEWSKGTKTKEALERLADSGGRTIHVDPMDLTVFDALRKMREEKHPNLSAWLASRKPASNTRLLADAFGEGATAVRPGGPSGGPAPSPEPAQQSKPPVPAGGPMATAAPPAAIDPSSPIVVGSTVNGGKPLRIGLEALRRHLAIFAGSGSGKTVLIRRIVEECALRGISSIVLDPGNDLARLGDAWPTAPSAWGDGDDARAADYLANTDVVIWTPRQPAGRPLAFQPLPDFGAIQSDPYELQQAIEAAVAMLAPRAKVAGPAAKALHGRAVLQEAMEYFARRAIPACAHSSPSCRVSRTA